MEREKGRKEGGRGSSASKCSFSTHLMSSVRTVCHLVSQTAVLAGGGALVRAVQLNVLDRVTEARVAWRREKTHEKTTRHSRKHQAHMKTAAHKK